MVPISKLLKIVVAVLLQVRCHFCCPINSVKAAKV